ncbi:MAG: hypothetical protein Q4B48_00150 [Syntrophomonadaceae bacterium]|nr:hypothetical protein [Syntrophomonadaceae bacterium]
MLKRKRIALLLIMALLMSLTATPAWAQSSTAPGVRTLEEALVIAKTHFTVPDNLDEFNSWYNDYQYPAWELNWNNSNGKGYMSIGVNALSGDITSMHQWNETDYQAAGGLQLSLADAQAVAAAKLAALLPDKAGSLRLRDDLTNVNLSGTPSAYFSWERYAGDIPVQGDYVTMTINMRDGSVQNYQMTWNDSPLPAADAAIDAEAAAQAFKDAGMLELQYMLPQEYHIWKDGVSTPLTAIPVYYLRHESQGIIDALTGEPLVNAEGGAVYAEEAPMANDVAKLSGGGGGGVILTPQELQEISATEKLISQEQAIAAVNKWFKLDPNLRLISSSLQADWNDGTRRHWMLTWEYWDDSDYMYADASVNAATSEVTRFYSGSREGDTATGRKLSADDAKKIADKLGAAIAPDKFKLIRAEQMDDMYGDEATQYNFNYIRVVNDIPFYGHGMNITVNRATGEVTSYNLNWDQVEFAPLDGVIDPAAAQQHYLDQSPLDLRYVQFYARDQRTLQLAYVPDFALSDATVFYLDAKTGVAIDSMGNAMTAGRSRQAFNDVAGHFAEAEITLMGQAGLMGEYGEAFMPDEDVTVISLLRALYGLGYGDWYITTDDEEIMRTARDNNLIDASVAAGDNVNREQASVIIIRYLGMQRVADIPGIYATPWQDGSVSAANHGYAALCWGLDIMRGDGVNFHGQQNVTRAETACILLRAMNVRM